MTSNSTVTAERWRPSPTTTLTLDRGAGDRWVLTELRWMFTHFRAHADGGWRPTMTAPPPDWVAAGVAPRWTGSYCPALGQTVSAPDAAAMADAIDVILANDAADRIGPPLHRIGDDDLCEWVDDDTLRAFVLFLRRGAFALVPLDSSEPR